MLKKTIFLLPFASFIAGYFLIQLLFTSKELYVPHLVGKNIIEATELLSAHNLNLRILAHKEDTDLPPYTILSQTPQPDEKIKPQQSIYLVVSSQKAINSAPDLVNKSLTSIRADLEQLGIKPIVQYVPSPYPKDICIAQSPLPGEALEQKNITLYFPAQTKKPIIWPNFRGKPLGIIKELLETVGVAPQIIASDRGISNESVVLDQRPKAGTLLILDESRPISVQLSVQ